MKFSGRYETLSVIWLFWNVPFYFQFSSDVCNLSLSSKVLQLNCALFEHETENHLTFYVFKVEMVIMIFIQLIRAEPTR